MQSSRVARVGGVKGTAAYDIVATLVHTTRPVGGGQVVPRKATPPACLFVVHRGLTKGDGRALNEKNKKTGRSMLCCG